MVYADGRRNQNAAPVLSPVFIAERGVFVLRPDVKPGKSNIHDIERRREYAECLLRTSKTDEEWRAQNRVQVSSGK